MKLIRADITEFASLHNCVIEFGDRLNIIEGDNESGKSTLLAFIRFVFYGLSGRASGDEPSERDKYLNWSSRRAAGSLTFESGGRLWRVEREGAIAQSARGEVYNEKIQIIDAETGSVEQRGVKAPGELFLGMSAEVFSSTCCVAQLSSQMINGGEVGNRIENMLHNADESINVERAGKRLDDARRELLHKNNRGGRIYDLGCECESLRVRLDAAENASKRIAELEVLADECRERIAAEKKKEDDLESVWSMSEAWITLGRFDEARALGDELEGLRSDREKLRSEIFSGAMIPEDADTARITRLARSLDDAEAELESARLRQSRHESIPTYDKLKAETADLLGEVPSVGKNTVIREAEELQSKIKKKSGAGAAVAICGGVALLGGIAMLILSLGMLPVIAASAVGVAAILGGVILLSSSKTEKKELGELFMKYGADLTGEIPALSRLLDDCIAASAARANYLTALDALRDVTEIKEKDLSELKKTAVAELARFGESADVADSAASLRDRLNLVSGEICDFLKSDGDLAHKIQRSESELASLRESLSQCDEEFLRRRTGRLAESEAISAEEYDIMREKYRQSIRAADEKKSDIDRQIISLQAQAVSPAKISAQLEERETEIAALTLRVDALDLAREAIAEASGQMRRGFTPSLRREAGELMSKFSSGRYSDVGISDELGLSLFADGATRDIGYMSGGTRDAAYLSLRLALTKLLGRDDTPPVLLDESLTQLDEGRASGVINMLSDYCAEGNQCLIFTCHSREAALAKDYKHIRLG